MILEPCAAKLLRLTDNVLHLHLVYAGGRSTPVDLESQYSNSSIWLSSNLLQASMGVFFFSLLCTWLYQKELHQSGVLKIFVTTYLSICQHYVPGFCHRLYMA